MRLSELATLGETQSQVLEVGFHVKLARQAQERTKAEGERVRPVDEITVLQFRQRFPDIGKEMEVSQSQAELDATFKGSEHPQIPVRLVEFHFQTRWLKQEQFYVPTIGPELNCTLEQL